MLHSFKKLQSFFQSKLFLCLVVVLFISSFSYGITKFQALQKLLVIGASDYHFSQQEVDDFYSEEAFNLYLDRLDPNKRFFTKEDIVDLSVYKLLVDNEIKK